MTLYAIEIADDEAAQLVYLNDFDPVTQRSNGILYAMARRIGAALPAEVAPAVGTAHP